MSAAPGKPFRKTPKQKKAISLMAKFVEVLLEGGSRSGKTFIAIYAIFVRALKHPKSNHVIVRKHFNHVKQSIWKQTIPQVIEKAFPGLKYKENKSDWFIELHNGSTIYIHGTDDKERIEKILGTEWDTIYINEASQIPYETYDTLKSRLNPQEGIKPLFLIDYNPPSKNHWGYKIFHEGIDPESKEPVARPERYARIKMNPEDNRENLSETYFDTLDSMTESRRRRFKDGLYGDDSEFAIWKRSWISQNRIANPVDAGRLKQRMEFVIVSVDPAVTDKKTSDDTGIIIAGRMGTGKEAQYYVMDDRTCHDDIYGWGEGACQAYKDYEANVVIGEVNNGGDLVEMNIRTYDPNINYEYIRATKGKRVRAEPVAGLYKRGFVHHLGEFPELEDQMCTWTEDAGESPNNMDALVWAIMYLAGIAEGDFSALYEM